MSLKIQPDYLQQLTPEPYQLSVKYDAAGQDSMVSGSNVVSITISTVYKPSMRTVSDYNFFLQVIKNSKDLLSTGLSG